MSNPLTPADRATLALRDFMAQGSAGGVALVCAAAVSLILANSPLAGTWHALVHTPILSLSVETWVNDGLMAVFFLLVGLEIKRELLEGELSTWRRRALPGFAAVGGLVLPAVLYGAVNLASPATLKGWAIPSATDIAFALAVLSLLGSRVPPALKVFLTALAILDDLGAIAVIGVFYTQGLVWKAVAGAVLMGVVLLVLNRLHVMRLWAYAIPGVALWWFLHHSGIHATLAGVAVAAAIPARQWPARPDRPEAPLHVLEHALEPVVAYAVLPLFALINAGVEVRTLAAGAITAPAPMGVLAGLVLGKQAGVFGAAWLAVRTGLANRPQDASWLQLYGVAILCGVGFTMSLFISSLAFSEPNLIASLKAAILIGSALSAALSVMVLLLARTRASPRAG